MEVSGKLNATNDAQQLRAIFETAVDCLIIIDSNGLISKINPAGARLFGYEIEELIGKQVSILMPTPHRELHDSYIEKYKKTGEKKIIGIGRDVMAMKKDGTTFPCKLSVSEFYMNEKRCFAGIIHDLTERKKAEEKIIELNKTLEEKVKAKTEDLSSAVSKLLLSNQKLEKEISEKRIVEKALRDSELEIKEALKKERELNELKSRFISLASHEFRTPLSTILSSTTLVQKYVEKGEMEKTTKHFERIQSSVKNLTEILDDFLSLSKLEEGKIQNNPEWFKLADFCKEFIDQIEGLLKTGQVVIKDLPVNGEKVFLDKKLIRNILLNIFSNAIKYSDEGKSIYCHAAVLDSSPSSTQKELLIKIRDEGMGIPLSEQKHLFSRFYRGSNVINIKGTGLGLNIVRQYLTMLNGDIHFESEEGLGTTFTIRIPF